MAARVSTISSSRASWRALTWQVSRATRSPPTSTRSTSTAATTCSPIYDPETAATVWNSPAYHTTAIKWTSPMTSSLFLEAGYSNNTEYYTNEYREGIEKPSGSAPSGSATAAKNEVDLGGYTQAGPINTTESPVAFYWNAAATWVKGDHTIKFGANNRQGTFKHTRLANADLVQQYRSSDHRRPLVGARHGADPQHAAVLLGAPEPRPRHLHPGLVAPQPADREHRPAVGDTERAGQRRQVRRPAASCRSGPSTRSRTCRRGTTSPRAWRWSTTCSATAGRRSSTRLNRYNLSRTTGIAANYNPLLSQTATLPWRDINGNDIADGALRCRAIPSADCEIDFASLPANYGIAALNEYGAYPRTWNLESGLEVQHELLRRPLGQRCVVDRAVPQPDDDDQPVVDAWPTTRRTRVHNPTTGQPFPVYARSVAATEPPDAKPRHVRPGAQAEIRVVQRSRAAGAFRAAARSRAAWRSSASGRRTAPRRTIRTTSPPPPACSTARALCDDFALDIPYRPQIKTVGHEGNRLGHQRQHGVPEQLEPDQLAADGGDARHDALSGELPGAVPGRRRSSCRRRCSARRR